MIYIAVSLALLGVASYLFFSGSPLGFLKGKPDSVLSNGSTGSDVKRLQNYLINQGHSIGSADGVFGSKTGDALYKETNKNSISVKELNKLT